MLINITVEQGDMKVNLEISEQTLKDLQSPVKVTIPEESKPKIKIPMTDYPNVEPEIKQLKRISIERIRQSIIDKKVQKDSGELKKLRLNNEQRKLI